MRGGRTTGRSTRREAPMSEVWLAAAGWLLRVALGGGLLLLVTWLAVRRVRQPARQQRLAECGVAAALALPVLCLMPTWLMLPLLPRPRSPDPAAERGADGDVAGEKAPAAPALPHPGD